MWNLFLLPKTPKIVSNHTPGSKSMISQCAASLEVAEPPGVQLLTCGSFWSKDLWTNETRCLPSMCPAYSREASIGEPQQILPLKEREIRRHIVITDSKQFWNPVRFCYQDPSFEGRDYLNRVQFSLASSYTCWAPGSALWEDFLFHKRRPLWILASLLSIDSWWPRGLFSLFNYFSSFQPKLTESFPKQ